MFLTRPKCNRAPNSHTIGGKKCTCCDDDDNHSAVQWWKKSLKAKAPSAHKTQYTPIPNIGIGTEETFSFFSLLSFSLIHSLGNGTEDRKFIDTLSRRKSLH